MLFAKNIINNIYHVVDCCQFVAVFIGNNLKEIFYGLCGLLVLIFVSLYARKIVKFFIEHSYYAISLLGIVCIPMTIMLVNAEYFPYIKITQGIFTHVIISETSIPSFIGCVAAVDGVILTLGISLSLNKISNIKLFFQSQVVDEIINDDRLLKFYPWLVVSHLFYSLMLFFFIKSLGVLSMLFLICILFILITFMFAYFNRIEQYASFSNLKINNNKLKKLLKEYKKSYVSFFQLVNLLRSIIKSSATVNLSDERIYKYVDNMSAIYKKLSKRIHLEEYKKVFLKKMDNGFSFNQLNYIPYVLLQIYEHAQLNNNTYLKLLITRKLAEIAPYSINEELKKKNPFENNDISTVLHYLVRVSVNNVKTYEDTASLDKLFLYGVSYQWLFNLLKDERLSDYSYDILEEALKIFVDAIDSNKVKFIDDFIDFLYTNPHDCYYCRKIGKFNEKARKSITILYLKVMQYALYRKAYNVISMCLKKEPADGRSLYSFSPLPTHWWNFVLLFKSTYDKFFQIKGCSEGYLLFEKILITLITRITIREELSSYKSTFDETVNLQQELFDESYKDIDKIKNTAMNLKQRGLEEFVKDDKLISTLFEFEKAVDKKILIRTIREKLDWFITEIEKEMAKRVINISCKDVSVIMNENIKTYGRPFWGILNSLYKANLVTERNVCNVKGYDIDIKKVDYLMQDDIGNIYKNTKDFIEESVKNKFYSKIDSSKINDISLSDIGNIIRGKENAYILLVSGYYTFVNELLSELKLPKVDNDKIGFNEVYTLENGLLLFYLPRVRYGQIKKGFTLINRDFTVKRNSKKDKVVDVSDNGDNLKIVVNEEWNVSFKRSFEAYSIII